MEVDPVRAGRLDRQVAIQRKTATPSDSGEPVETWTTLSQRPASASPVSGDERFAGDQWVGREQTEFRVRWAEVIRDLSPLDRIIYPASVADSPVEIAEVNIYDILAVHELGRREGFRVIASRRADVRP